MAITVGNNTNSGNPGSASSYSWSHTVDTNTTLLVVVVVGLDTTASDLPVTGVTLGGTALSNAHETVISNGAGEYNVVSIWYISNPSSGTIEITHAGKCTDTGAFAINLLGTETTNTFDSYDDGTIGALSTAIVNPAATGSIVIGGHLARVASTTNTDIRSGYGTLIDELDVGWCISCGYNYESSGIASVGFDDSMVGGGFTMGCTFKPATITSVNIVQCVITNVSA